ncbi:cytidine deaminase [Brevibacterium casei]|uniref:Cytidine deaminase n=2 Tax=Brevibacterium casei TaxID=33889 RepID=A0A2H1K4V8_9MICO|nr:cytidine deaminase [Brevibacterium casei]SMX94604.1 cytidine deaminase [Brevibacterium casei CIP 102111]
MMSEPTTGDGPMWSEPERRVEAADLTEDTWDLLRASAVAAMEKAYAPYSAYPVGAAALVDDGRIVSGCNIENASYGVTLCAECSLVSDLLMTGGGRLVAFDCVDGQGRTLVPCGRCRQLLFEHGGPDLVLNMPAGRETMAVVLPDAFGPDNLGEHIGRHASDAGGAAGDSPAGDGGDDAAGDDGTADSLGEHNHPKH